MKLLFSLFVVVLLGAGCASVDQQEETVKNEVSQIKTNEIGLTIDSPDSWGEFVVELETDATGEQLYRGTFSEESRVVYHNIKWDTAVARGGYPGDVNGYYAEGDDYYIVLGQGNFQVVPSDLVVNEVVLVNGFALMLLGEHDDGPSFFPNDVGEIVVYLNTPKGPDEGGVFIAEPGVSTEDMEEMLASVSIIE